MYEEDKGLKVVAGIDEFKTKTKTKKLQSTQK